MVHIELASSLCPKLNITNKAPSFLFDFTTPFVDQLAVVFRRFGIRPAVGSFSFRLPDSSVGKFNNSYSFVDEFLFRSGYSTTTAGVWHSIGLSVDSFAK